MELFGEKVVFTLSYKASRHIRWLAFGPPKEMRRWARLHHLPYPARTGVAGLTIG